MQDKDQDRLVLACKGINERLPFKNESFDCYIASFSLHLVNDHILQI
jgi:ubiquinone/menaquinone biosynthesis C-methylase UbiE